MKKRIIPRKLLYVLLSCCFLLSMLAACDSGETTNDDATSTPPPAPESPAEPALPSNKTGFTIDFDYEKIDFFMANTGSPGTDPDTTIAIREAEGTKGLSMTAPNGGTLRLGINVDGLLGDDVTKVKTIVIDVYAEYPDGSFSPVSGRIGVMSGSRNAFAEGKWQVYIASRNPNPAIFEFDADQGFSAEGPNLVEFSCLVNGPADKGETPAIIHIKSISFYDANNTGLKMNLDAGWAAPENYGEGVILSEWELLNPPLFGDPGGWQEWRSPGKDGYEGDDMPWEVVAASYGIVIESEPPESFEFVYYGEFNGWSWTQNQITDYYADGAFTVMWSDLGFDPSLLNATDDQVAFAMGNWNKIEVTRAYLLYDADMVP